uniref:Zinc finger protein 385A n=1 Tax=Cyprinus carpio TaxID=7962 RepID=A0A8C2H0H8_CYPCA
MSDTLTLTLPHTNTSSLMENPMQLRDPSASEDMKMDPVQKAVINHTFGVPLVKTKRPIISCNVCQIRFNSESQAEAHYKGNRHARRIKGIETSKSRPQESDKPPPGPVSSPSPTGPLPAISDTDPSKTDETRSAPQLNGPVVAPEPMAISAPPTPESPGPSACPLLPTPTTPQPPPATSSSPCCGSSNPEQTGTGAPGAPSVTPSNPETEEDKAKKLLYCSLCKVAVNSLSQLEAHNKGTKHKTILEARSGLGPIKAYPRLGPKPSGEQGGGATDPNTQERTFHCEICNVRVNSELQLKQVSEGHGVHHFFLLNAHHVVFTYILLLGEKYEIKFVSKLVCLQHISSRRHRDGTSSPPAGSAPQPRHLETSSRAHTHLTWAYSVLTVLTPPSPPPSPLANHSQSGASPPKAHCEDEKIVKHHSNDKNRPINNNINH